MNIKLKNNLFLNSALVSIFLLNLIWLIPHTIALRNILISLSTLLLISAFLNKKITLNHRWPILFIVVTILWLAFHVIYIGLEKEIQFSEYISTWLRSILGFLIGLSLTSCLNKEKYSSLRKFFFLSGTILFILNCITYYIKNEQIYLSGMYDPLFQSKIGLMLACFPGMAYLINAAFKNFEGGKRVFTIFFVLVAYFIVFKVGSTRNGMLITVIMAIFLFIIWIIKEKKYTEFLVVFLSLILIILYGADYFIYLIQDFINAYENYEVARLWMESDFKNKTDIYNNLSNYIRVSHFMAGLELLFHYPFGYGLLEESFPKLGVLYWGSQFKYRLNGTHSGLLDLGLAYGTGLIIIIIFFKAYLLSLGLKTKSYFIVGCVVTIFFILLFSESASKNNIEYIFFILGIISIKNDK